MSDTNPLAGLYKLEQSERRQLLAQYVNLNDEDLTALDAGLSAEQADVMGLSDALSSNMLLRLGWGELAQLVDDVVEDLPAEDREGLVLLAHDDGQAGALERLTRLEPAPPVYCGHNAWFDWAPTGGAGPAVAVAWPLHRLRDLYEDPVRLRVHEPQLADPQEMWLPVYACRTPKRALSEAWPGMRSLWADAWLD